MYHEFSPVIWAKLRPFSRHIIVEKWTTKLKSRLKPICWIDLIYSLIYWLFYLLYLLYLYSHRVLSVFLSEMLSSIRQLLRIIFRHLRSTSVLSFISYGIMISKFRFILFTAISSRVLSGMYSELISLPHFSWIFFSVKHFIFSLPLLSLLFTFW